MGRFGIPPQNRPSGARVFPNGAVEGLDFNRNIDLSPCRDEKTLGDSAEIIEKNAEFIKRCRIGLRF